LKHIVSFSGGKDSTATLHLLIDQGVPISHRLCGIVRGRASVLIRKPRSHAEVYNDLDEDIVNVFRVLRGPGPGRQAGKDVPVDSLFPR